MLHNEEGRRLTVIVVRQIPLQMSGMTLFRLAWTVVLLMIHETRVHGRSAERWRGHTVYDAVGHIQISRVYKSGLTRRGSECHIHIWTTCFKDNLI